MFQADVSQSLPLVEDLRYSATLGINPEFNLQERLIAMTRSESSHLVASLTLIAGCSIPSIFVDPSNRRMGWKR